MLSISTQIAPGESLTQFEQMLKSASFASQITIFNLGRTDQAAKQLFRKYKARVIETQLPKIIEHIRGSQVEAAGGDWVLILDYDEVITPALKEEIIGITKNNASCSSYAIGRDNYSLGFHLTHGGWERDYVVRLLKQSDFIAWPKNIHSTPQVKGSTIKTVHALEHHKDESISQMVAKTNRYSEIEAAQFAAGLMPPVTSLTILRKWFMETIRRLVLKRGFLDGQIGVIQSLYQGYSVFITYAKLFERQQLHKSSNSSPNNSSSNNSSKHK